jgi:hypothetical protein
MPDARCRMPDARCRMPDAGNWTFVYLQPPGSLRLPRFRPNWPWVFWATTVNSARREGSPSMNAVRCCAIVLVAAVMLAGCRSNEPTATQPGYAYSPYGQYPAQYPTQYAVPYAATPVYAQASECCSPCTPVATGVGTPTPVPSPAAGAVSPAPQTVPAPTAAGQRSAIRSVEPRPAPR